MFIITEYICPWYFLFNKLIQQQEQFKESQHYCHDVM